MAIKDLCPRHGRSALAHYLWRSRFGGIAVPDAKRLHAHPGVGAAIRAIRRWDDPLQAQADGNARQLQAARSAALMQHAPTPMPAQDRKEEGRARRRAWSRRYLPIACVPRKQRCSFDGSPSGFRASARCRRCWSRRYRFGSGTATWLLLCGMSVRPDGRGWPMG